MQSELNLRYDSFIAGWYIDADICKELVQYFEDNFESSQYDQKRQYHRLSSFSVEKFLNKAYLKELTRVIDNYKILYPWSYKMSESWSLCQPYNLQRFDPSEHYKFTHIEDPGPRPDRYQRHLTFLTYLNTVEDAGETEFVHQDVKVKPYQGLTLVWPAGWTHPHHGIASATETKYIATGWTIFKHKN